MSLNMHLTKHIIYQINLQTARCNHCGKTLNMPMQGPVADFKAQADLFINNHKNCTE